MSKATLADFHKAAVYQDAVAAWLAGHPELFSIDVPCLYCGAAVAERCRFARGGYREAAHEKRCFLARDYNNSRELHADNAGKGALESAGRR